MIAAPKLVSHPVIKTFCGADKVGDHGLALNAFRQSQGCFQRLMGLIVGFCLVTLWCVNFGDRRVLKFLNGAFYVFFLRHQGGSPYSVHSQDSIARQST